MFTNIDSGWNCIPFNGQITVFNAHNCRVEGGGQVNHGHVRQAYPRGNRVRQSGKVWGSITRRITLPQKEGNLQKSLDDYASPQILAHASPCDG